MISLHRFPIGFMVLGLAGALAVLLLVPSRGADVRGQVSGGGSCPISSIRVQRVSALPGGVPQAVSVRDFNGDGRADVAVAYFADTEHPGRLVLYRGHGNGTYGEGTETRLDTGVDPYDGSSLSSFLAQGMAAADFDGDGDQDLAVSGYHNIGAHASSGEVVVLRNRGDGTFDIMPLHSPDADSFGSIFAVDTTGDTTVDLVTFGWPAPGRMTDVLHTGLSVFTGKGDGTFTAEPVRSFGYGSPKDVATGDVDRDGRADFAIANRSILLLLGKDLSTPALELTESNDYTGVAIGDTNGDLEADIVGSARPPSIIASVGDGQGGQRKVQELTKVPWVAPRLGDLNGDGILDLVVLGRGMGIFGGKGDGTFQAVTTVGIGMYADEMEIADVDGDGKLDIVAADPTEASSGGQGTVLVYRNVTECSAASSSLPSSASPLPLLSAAATSSQSSAPTSQGTAASSDLPLSSSTAVATSSASPSSGSAGGALGTSSAGVQPSGGPAGPSVCRALCGNGFVKPGFEECDDGNTINGDGCSALCRQEKTVSSSSSSLSLSLILCGNKVKEMGEGCDTDVQGICRAAPCANSCSVGEACFRARCLCINTLACGNGKSDPGEECGEPGLSCPMGAVCETSGEVSLCRCRDVVSRSSSSASFRPWLSSATTLSLALCGNTVKEGTEQCDTEVTGICSRTPCSNDCNLGEACFRKKCLCINTLACGNGKNDAGEECGEPGLSCPVGTVCETSGGVSLCRCGEPPACGNSVREEGEACDDGNKEDTDACSNHCLLGIGQRCHSDTQCRSGYCFQNVCRSRCGNGQLEQPQEECDDGNIRDFDGCTSDCLLERGLCGDGVLQKLLGETCEPPLVSPSAPYYCGKNCRLVSKFCGDGRLSAGEECDEGKKNADTPDAHCRTNCSLARCGDSILDAGEECDDGKRVAGDGCDRSCHREQSAAPAKSAAPALGGQLLSMDPGVWFRLPPGASCQLHGQCQTNFCERGVCSFCQSSVGCSDARQCVAGLCLGNVGDRCLASWQCLSRYCAAGSCLPSLPPLDAPLGQTGPEVIAIMAAGAAGGFAWLRRRRP